MSLLDLFDAEELEQLRYEEELDRAANQYYFEDDLIVLREDYHDKLLQL